MPYIVIALAWLISSPALAQAAAVEETARQIMLNCLYKSQDTYILNAKLMDKQSAEYKALAGNNRELCLYGRNKAIPEMQKGIDRLEAMRGSICFDENDASRISDLKRILVDFRETTKAECIKAGIR